MWWHTGFSSFLHDYLGEQYNNETGAGLQMGIGRCGTQGLLEREELCQVSGLRWCLGNHEIVLLQNCFLWSLLSRDSLFRSPSCFPMELQVLSHKMRGNLA